EKPKIIRQVLNCYNYTNKRFQLGLPIVENPKIILDQEKIKIIKTLVSKKAEEDKFGFQKIKYSIKNTNSYFQFILNPYSKNIEKVEYSVSNLEELIVFLERLMELAKKQNLNYIECFVSSYKPKDQKVFLNAGFNPRGYVPCWRYNKSINFFEDYIVFNFFKGKIDQNMKIIPETEQFLNDINILEDKFKGESEIIRS
ncbi:MAG: hypothetical protein ACFFAK_11960, partial [Promethearchaeota archaeon]